MSANGMIQSKGVAITFTLTTPGTIDATLDTAGTPSTATVAGYWLEIAGDYESYRALELIVEHSKTGHFAPTTAGEVPALGARCTIGSTEYVVRGVRPIAPAGTATRAMVIVSR